jgi:O-antigen/teichoic acid export membrane protein
MTMLGGSNSGLEQLPPHPRAAEGARARVPFWHKVPGLTASLAAKFMRGHASRDLHAVLSSAATVMAIRLAGAVLAYVSTIFLARWLGSFEFGIYAYVWVVVLLFANALTLGYPSSMLRFVPDYLARAKWSRLRGLLRESFAIVAVSSIAGAALAALLLAAFAGRVEPYYVTPAFIGILCVPPAALLMHTELTARAFGWMQLAYAPAYIARPILVMAIVFALYASGLEPDAIAAVSALTAAGMIAAAGQGLVVRRAIARAVPAARPARHTRHWAAISGSFILIDGSRQILENADVILVGQLLDPSAVAAYYAAARTGGLIAFIYFAVVAMAAPRFAKMHASGSRADMQSFVSGIIHLMFWPSALAAAGLALLGPAILSLFGAGFGEGYPVLLIVLAGLLVRAATGPVEYMLAMTGHHRDTVRVYGICAAASIALNFLMVPLLGVTGAALSAYGAIAGANVWLAGLVKKRLGLVALLGFSAR